MGWGQSNIAHSSSANRRGDRRGWRAAQKRGVSLGARGGCACRQGEDGIMTDIVTTEWSMGRGSRQVEGGGRGRAQLVE